MPRNGDSSSGQCSLECPVPPQWLQRCCRFSGSSPAITGCVQWARTRATRSLSVERPRAVASKGVNRLVHVSSSARPAAPACSFQTSHRAAAATTARAASLLVQPTLWQRPSVDGVCSTSQGRTLWTEILRSGNALHSPASGAHSRQTGGFLKTPRMMPACVSAHHIAKARRGSMW